MRPFYSCKTLFYFVLLLSYSPPSGQKLSLSYRYCFVTLIFIMMNSFANELALVIFLVIILFFIDIIVRIFKAKKLGSKTQLSPEKRDWLSICMFVLSILVFFFTYIDQFGIAFNCMDALGRGAITCDDSVNFMTIIRWISFTYALLFMILSIKELKSYPWTYKTRRILSYLFIFVFVAYLVGPRILENFLGM